MKNRNNNMLLRIAQGDAFAAGVEYVKENSNKELYESVRRFDKFVQHPTHRALRPGMYTDDAQMSIAVAEVLINKPDGWVSRDFSDAWFEVFKRDPRDGYSRGFQTLLEQATSADHLRLMLKPDSNKNGAAMRSVPLGVIHDPKAIMAVAGMQASTTHASWGGINSSQATALMSHFALRRSDKFSLLNTWGSTYCPAFEYFREPWEGPVGGKSNNKRNLGVGMCTAWAVHTLLVEETTLMGMMRRIIDWGGDTDSVAAIAWGIASARCQNEELPEFMEYCLEPGRKYGVQFLKDLGTQLMDHYTDVKK